jgi:hypothetical protein
MDAMSNEQTYEATEITGDEARARINELRAMAKADFTLTYDQAVMCTMGDVLEDCITKIDNTDADLDGILKTLDDTLDTIRRVVPGNRTQEDVRRNAYQTLAGIKNLLTSEARDKSGLDFRPTRPGSSWWPQAFQDRVIEEHDQLIDKLDRLEAFLEIGPQDGMTMHEYNLLREQRDAMALYAQTLKQRVQDFD